MPPSEQPSSTAQGGVATSYKKESGHGGHRERERIGNYIVGSEIGRGSFATVFKGYKSKSREPVAIKAVARGKLTPKLLENLESEINILKAIQHTHIVKMQDCFKNDSNIFLIMDFCSGGDLSVYIKNRGKLPTLDFIPRPVGSRADGSVPTEGEKIYWPHPPIGGLDEKVTRSFLGQLSSALQFLRTQNLIHRDIKPQNLLLQPASPEQIADGHPLGIPVLKVADFGFARILPAAAMAETLCGSPLYMAPEILRYERYDAKVDLWSVGAVLYEMAVGRPPFRASNHVELLHKIERGDEYLKFPEDSSRIATITTPDGQLITAARVPPDIKRLIKSLLRRMASDRLGFDDFFACGVWDGYMTESIGGDSTSIDASTSTDTSSDNMRRSEIQELVASAERARTGAVPRHAPQPLSTQAALNPQPAVIRQSQSSLAEDAAVAPPPLVPQPVRQSLVRRSEPKYYVSDDSPSTPVQTPAPTTSNPPRAGPRPIVTTAQRRVTSRAEAASIEEAPPITPSSMTGPIVPSGRCATRGVNEGSPLAATPPMTMGGDDETGKEDSALEGSDSVLGREYVVVEKRTVEINKLADELDQASLKRTTLARRPSSRTSVVTRPVSTFKPVIPTSSSPQPASVIPLSYSPPFAFSSTPPFAIPPTARHSPSNNALSRPPSIPQSLNIFPPAPIAGAYHAQDNSVPRYGSSPSSLQTGALARALTNTAIRIIGTSANQAATVIAKAAAKRRPTILRSTAEVDPAEDELLTILEDSARKAFVLFELADAKIVQWSQYARGGTTPSGVPISTPGLSGGAVSHAGTPPFAVQPFRRRSSSSSNSEVQAIRLQEALAGEAMVLYMKALAFIIKGSERVQRYFDKVSRKSEYEMSQELNETVQWFRARFNECYEKAEWAKTLCAEELPFVERILHDRAKEVSRQAALSEISGDLSNAETGYETSIWLLNTLLDDVIYDGGHIRDEDRVSVEKLIAPIKVRYEALKRKISDSSATREPSKIQ